MESIAEEWQPDLQLAVKVESSEQRRLVGQLRVGGLENVGWIQAPDLHIGDVFVPNVDKAQATVLIRESDVHHSLPMTNRCNSYCLMCSQPPTRQNDDWLVAEALDVVAHMRQSPSVLGLSGGEPLLLGKALRRVLDSIASKHPTTQVEVLTNGRLLSNQAVAEDVLNGLTVPTSWLVPLYGHADFLHDFVVQARGAFEETLAGLLVLQERSQPIQLRVVLIEPVLQVLPELCEFIGRNLPFVREVALMACEPTGFALANADLCAVDLADWTPTLMKSASVLRRHRVRYLLMNTPLCALPRQMWKDAHRSISDWKNVFAPECDGCAVRQKCSGLFAWHERRWKPTKIKAIEEVDA